jgi:DNA sulfur modification protein DndD
MDRRGDKSDRRRQLIEQLDEINAELDGIETENIAGLEDRRKELKAGIVRFTEQIGAIKSEIESLEETKSKIEKKRTKAKEKNQTADLARRRAETASYVGGQIEDLFEKFQDKVRSNVNDRVNETFRSVIEKDYYAQIGENYSLKILKDVGDTEEEAVAKSTGERQVASLSFISSLVSLAKERYESDKDSSYFTGGIYPMLMDSPFGYLDPTYQQRISRTLPEMGEQVIVLVTESQWSEAVAGEMAKIAGQRYELDYVADEDYEYTEIVAAGGS